MKSNIIYLTAIILAIHTPFSSTKAINETLKPFEVEFISGCNAINHSKIKVYLKDEYYYAEHLSPTYFDGQKIDSLWTIKLNQDQTHACMQFLDKAKSLPSNCDRNRNHFSSSENHHIILIDKEIIDINGECNWENLDFEFLDTQLFGTKHSEIEKRKKLYLINLDKELEGKWYLQPLKKDLQRDDVLTYSRTEATTSFIIFGSKESLTGNCNELLKTKDLKHYKTKLSDGWNETVIIFNWGKSTGKSQYTALFESSATFTLKSIDKNELKLNFLWTDN